MYDENRVREDYKKLTKLLIDKGLTITTMESSTAGQVASLITDTEGSSAVIKGAFITYSNEAKIKHGVPKEIIDTYSVYSRETARAMAETCRKAYSADIGIGVTGTMGNVDPANANVSIPGNIYFAIDFNGMVTDYYIQLSAQPSRLMYKLAVSQEIVNVLLAMLA